MTERQIRLFGDPVLKTVSSEIHEIDDGVRALVEDLLDSVRPDVRAGVAAAQIGVNLRAFSYNVGPAFGYVLNPVIEELRGEAVLVDEGCLSVPGLWFPTMRHPEAVITGIDLEGKPVRIEGTGVLAQAFHHEVDHLDGLVYLDRLDKQRRRVAMKQVRESDWF